MIARFFSKHSSQRAARTLGRLGGKARAQQMREPFRAKARELRAQLGLAPDPRLS